MDNSFSGAQVLVISDTIVPIVTLDVATAAGFAFSMTLSSEDSLSGPSGFYDVEYREEGTNDWQLWQDETTETEMQFTVIPGHSLYFRVSSKDRVDNVGQSPELGPYTVELETRKYYYFGGQRAAMRVVTATTNQVYYLHGDHLGSVSLTTDSSGAVVAQARYMPYGEVRWESSPSLTDYGFTGQRLDGFGLMDFNARFYSQRLGRFISADTVVPNPGSAMDFDRYAYAAGNPLRYIDPTGHATCEDMPWECDEEGNWLPSDPIGNINDIDGDGVPELPDPSEIITIGTESGCDELTLVECFYARERLNIDGVMLISESQFNLLLVALFFDIYNRDRNSIDRSRYDTPFWDGYGIDPGTVCFVDGSCWNRIDVNYIAQGMWSAAENHPLDLGKTIVYSWKGVNHIINPETYPSWTPSEDTLYWFQIGYSAYKHLEPHYQDLVDKYEGLNISPNNDEEKR